MNWYEEITSGAAARVYREAPRTKSVPEGSARPRICKLTQELSWAALVKVTRPSYWIAPRPLCSFSAEGLERGAPSTYAPYGETGVSQT